MRLGTSNSWSLLCAGLLALTVACGDDNNDDGVAEAGNDESTDTSNNETGTGSGDGDGDPTTGDGDGDPTTTGDGDGDPTTTGDGDGDPTTTGDGDGDPTTGDGDGDPGNPDCFLIETPDECDANPDCQSVSGSMLKQNGPGSPCLEAPEFIGCIPMQGCGDAETWFCEGNNTKFLVPDTCGPEDAEPCEPPADPVAECP